MQDKILIGEKACNEAHTALWQRLVKGSKDGSVEFLSRVTKLLASELFTLSCGDGAKASAFLNEGIVPVVEKNLARLANDPEVKAMLALFGLMAQLGAKP